MSCLHTHYYRDYKDKQDEIGKLQEEIVKLDEKIDNVNADLITNIDDINNTISKHPGDYYSVYGKSGLVKYYDNCADKGTVTGGNVYFSTQAITGFTVSTLPLPNVSKTDADVTLSNNFITFTNVLNFTESATFTNPGVFYVDSSKLTDGVKYRLFMVLDIYDGATLTLSTAKGAQSSQTLPQSYHKLLTLDFTAHGNWFSISASKACTLHISGFAVMPIDSIVETNEITEDGIWFAPSPVIVSYPMIQRHKSVTLMGAGLDDTGLPIPSNFEDFTLYNSCTFRGQVGLKNSPTAANFTTEGTVTYDRGNARYIISTNILTVNATINVYIDLNGAISYTITGLADNMAIKCFTVKLGE